MDKVIFETNVPQAVALKYASGKRVESRYNEYEVYYSTTDGRALYASPALDQKIVELAPQAGQPFSVCKREIKEGQRKRIEWQVLPASERPAVTTPAAPQETTQIAPSGSTSPQNSAEMMPAQATLTQLMGGALIASIDALAAAREYGKTKGFDFNFNEEDCRACANSIFIQYFKDAETRARQQYYAQRDGRVNGGAAWQQ